MGNGAGAELADATGEVRVGGNMKQNKEKAGMNPPLTFIEGQSAAKGVLVLTIARPNDPSSLSRCLLRLI